MLHLLDRGLEALLRAALPPELHDIDVAFEAPDGEWGAGLTRPTINLFLRDVRRNLSERDAGRHVTTAGGQRVWQWPNPRADCRYLVTAWTSQVDDEHRILGEVLTALLRSPVLAGDHLPEQLRGLDPLPSLSVAASGADDQADFWSALGGQLKPGLDLTVTVTIDAAAARPTGPDIAHLTFALADTDGARGSGARVVRGRAARETAGCVVRSPRAVSTVGDDGMFAVRAEPGDEIVVESDPPARGIVPPAGDVRPRRR